MDLIEQEAFTVCQMMELVDALAQLKNVKAQNGLFHIYMQLRQVHKNLCEAIEMKEAIK
jgi:hypothetical protein